MPNRPHKKHTNYNYFDGVEETSGTFFKLPDIHVRKKVERASWEENAHAGTDESSSKVALVVIAVVIFCLGVLAFTTYKTVMMGV